MEPVNSPSCAFLSSWWKHNYFNPEWQVLAEYDNSNNLQRYYVYGNYIDEPLVMRRQSDSEDFYYAGDHLYSTVALIGYVDPAWVVVERYEYDAYGKMTRLDPDFTTWSGTEAGNPYFFTARRLMPRSLIRSSRSGIMPYAVYFCGNPRSPRIKYFCGICG